MRRLVARGLLVLGGLFAAGCWDFPHLGKSTCDTDSTALCDDFESGGLNAGHWTLSVTTGADATVDSVRAHRGRYALHLRTPMGGLYQGAFFRSTAAFSPAPDIYAREWIYMPTQNTSVSGVMGVSDPQSTKSAAIIANAHASINDTKGTIESQTLFPLDRWTCVELATRAVPPHAALYVDGQLAVEADRASLTPGAANAVEFGLAKYGLPAPAGESFVDDVVVALSGPIGCGP